jgi:hypothetical protein
VGIGEPFPAHAPKLPLQGTGARGLRGRTCPPTVRT